MLGTEISPAVRASKVRDSSRVVNNPDAPRRKTGTGSRLADSSREINRAANNREISRAASSPDKDCKVAANRLAISRVDNKVAARRPAERGTAAIGMADRGAERSAVPDRFNLTMAGYRSIRAIVNRSVT